MTCSQTVIEVRSRETCERQAGETTRNDGRRSHGATAAGREVGGERVTASEGEQINTG